MLTRKNPLKKYSCDYPNFTALVKDSKKDIRILQEELIKNNIKYKVGVINSKWDVPIIIIEKEFYNKTSELLDKHNNNDKLIFEYWINILTYEIMHISVPALERVPKFNRDLNIGIAKIEKKAGSN